MDSYPKNKKQIPGFCFLILCCVLLNYGGGLFASSLGLPLWLDTLGTMLAAFIAGPVVGAIVGATGNLVSYLAYGDPWIYAIVSIVIGVLTGIMTHRKNFGSLLSVLTLAAILAITATLMSIPLGILRSYDAVGNVWGDAAAAFFREKGIPGIMSLAVGQLYVELLDKLTILLLLYIILKVNKGILRYRNREEDRKKAEEARDKETEQIAVHVTALMLAAGLTFACAGGARAETAEKPGYGDYVQTVYSSTNGLPCGEANDIAQTKDGILWIGTYAGLYRYNGSEFRWMSGYDSVRNVNCLYVDEEGRLWIGTNDNGLSIVINEQVSNVLDRSTGLPANSVRSIVRSSDGYYYIGTTSSMQVLTLNYGLRQIATLSEVLYAEKSTADEKGNIATVSNTGILYLIRAGQILSSRQLTDRNTVFKSVTFDPEGYLLAATTGNRVFRFDISRDRFDEKEIWEFDGLNSITDLTYLPSGELFLSADNGIGFRMPDGTFERINTNSFNTSIDNMLMDYQGNLWFTSSRLGLLRMAPSDFRDIYSTAGMENRVVNTTVHWRNLYYFGTDKGLDAVSEDFSRSVQDELTEQLKGVRIRCMTVDADGHLWVCTYGSGLLEVEADGTQHVYDKQNGFPGDRTRLVKQLSDGTILAAGDTGLAFIRNHEITDVIGYEAEKISSMILTVSELSDGRILAGTDGNGIAILENREITRMLTREDGLSSEVILRTVPDHTGGVFIVTSNGLCYMDIHEEIRMLDTFPYFNNYDIWMGQDDRVFVLSSAGIFVADREEILSGGEITCELLDRRRGLNSSLTANSWTWYEESTGDLFLACDTGVFTMNPGKLDAGSRTFRLSVHSIRADGETVQIRRDGPIRIARGIGKLELEPEVINYTIQEPYVGYKLEGFDSNWTMVQHENLNNIVYTNLPSGSFRFRLAVFDNTQQNILSERSYPIVKEKAMYDHPAFILYILTVPMFAVGWITYMLVKRREERIERELAEANRVVEMGGQMVRAIGRAVDAKDKSTGGHSRRVALYSRQIAEAYGLSPKDCQEIEWSANLHDIGKIAIPDRILNKDSRLDDEEYATMKTHTVRGAEILEDFTLLDHMADGAAYHHERYDGRGYPKGLKGEEIPLYARIIGVADAFDAMTANRVYRNKMDFSYVLNELEKGRGTQFDTRFVDILLKLIREGRIDLKKIYGLDQEAAEEEAQKDGEHPDGGTEKA